MRVIFWSSLALIFYAYAGYALLLRLTARRHPVAVGPVANGQRNPRVSIVIAARNEVANLPRRLANLRALNYPQDAIETVIVSDGSTDETSALLEKTPHVVPIVLPVSAGKANALNHAVRAATGEILVFLDMRQQLDSQAVRELVAPFADAQVGAVSGELLLEPADGSHSSGGNSLGLYWKIEKLVRKLESASGSTVGVTGAIYAMRRELYIDLPPGTILDDVMVPMNVARAGRRIIFQPTAIARDRIFSEPGKEFRRKVRTLTGNYQLLRLAPWLLTPANPLLFRLISHKLMRLVVPLLLVLVLVTSALIGGAFYHFLLGAQLIFYGLAGVGSLMPETRRFRSVAIAYTFCMLNAAAAAAFLNFIRGREAVWT